MKETPNHKIRYPEKTDNNAYVADLQHVAEDTERELDDIGTDQLAVPGGAADKGKLLVVDNTGAAAFQAMKGDATIGPDGTVAIGAQKVLTAMLANLGVTTAKLADGSVTNQKIGLQAVGGENLKDQSVGFSHLGDKAIGQSKINDKAITPEKLSDALRPSGGAAAGTEALRALGTSASTAAAGNDSRLSDERTPKAGSATESKIGDGAVTSRKAKLTAGQISATGDLPLSGSVADVPGASLAITPAVASVLLVTATFRFQVAHPSAEADGSVAGYLDIDGSQQAHAAIFEIKAAASGGGTSGQATVSQTWAVPLTAGARTIKLRAKALGLSGGSAASCLGDGSGFLYMLAAT